jgi:hypothetical protein
MSRPRQPLVFTCYSVSGSSCRVCFQIALHVCLHHYKQRAGMWYVRVCCSIVIFLTQVMLLCRCKLRAWKVSSPMSMPHFQQYQGRRTLVDLNVHQDLLFVPGLVLRDSGILFQTAFILLWLGYLIPPIGIGCLWNGLHAYMASTTTYSRWLLSRETAKFLAAQGASVILGCRNVDRGLEAAADIREVENLVFGPVKGTEQRFLEVTCAT